MFSSSFLGIQKLSSTLCPARPTSPPLPTPTHSTSDKSPVGQTSFPRKGSKVDNVKKFGLLPTSHCSPLYHCFASVPVLPREALFSQPCPCSQDNHTRITTVTRVARKHAPMEQWLPVPAQTDQGETAATARCSNAFRDAENAAAL